MTNNILIATGIFPPEIGGPASYGKVLAEKLAEEKFKVTVITYSAKKKDVGDKKLPFRVIRISKKTPKFLRHVVYFLRTYWAAGKVNKIFALNAVSAGYPAYLVAKMRKKKFFVRIAGDYAWEIAIGKQKTFLLIDDFQKSPKKGWIKFLNNTQTKICQKADGVIVPSKYLAKIVHGWGIPNEKISVVYNGIDFPVSELTKEEARKQIAIPGSIIISAGRLVPWKGFRMLVKMMPKLLGISQFFRLVIIGSGPDKKILETMIKNLGLDKKVYLVGKKTKEEMAVFFAASDMFVLNTGYEGFSHQILEAMTAGLAVITTNVGGNKEVIEQGQNGFMVKYNDEFNLIEAIKTIWRETEMREKMVEEGQKTAKLFDVETMYRETIAVLSR